MELINKIKDKLKGKEPVKTESKDNLKDVKVYSYWLNQYKRALKKQPKEMWERAENRFSAKKQPFVNDFRKLYESSMAFLDQQEPSFKISPEEAFMGDIEAQKASECDGVYLKKVWREQHCQKFESQKLSSCLIRNFGATMPYFDIKKWMPAVKYIPAKNVLVDPDCEGLIENASWLGYCETIPAEEFRSWHPELSAEEFENIVHKTYSTLSDSEREGMPEEDLKLYKAVKVIHIYAKDSSAVVLMEGQKDLKKDLAEELQLDTPRRYIQLVEGWPKPIVDSDWPFDLDHDEFPITIMQFNRVPEDIYGFTDYSQMERLDEISDEVVKDIARASFRASDLKYLTRKNSMIDEVKLSSYMNSDKIEIIEGMLDADGNPLIVPVEKGTISGALMNAYTLLHDQSKEASGQNELLENADAATFKDVTAIAARMADANQHQRINRRLGGPYGFEVSIAEDAIKMLELAHQFVPQYSSVAVIEQTEVLDNLGMPATDMLGEPMTEEKEVLRELPWNEALQAIASGGKLIKLGVDAIVGPELAQYWSYGQPAQTWRLSTKVAVEPGTTRMVTKEQQAAIQKQLFLEVIQPFLMQTGRMDLIRAWIESIARLSSVSNIENLLPAGSELQQMMMQQQMMQEQMAQGQMGQAGGQPLNDPMSNGGEMQEDMNAPI